MKKRALGLATVLTLCISMMTTVASGVERYSCNTEGCEIRANENSYYYGPVMWAIDTKIIDKEFSEDERCTRAEVITLLWRAAGRPEPLGTRHKFLDIDETEYYNKSVQWAFENGITVGTDYNTFSPNMNCTRVQAVEFIYRFAQTRGEKLSSMWACDVEAVDIPDWARESIVWCYTFGITKGTSELTFSPNDECTKEQIITILYRYFIK